uniref:Bromodomain adjacent to zinc finger domain 2B n=1 Tax=Scophthalmus maximus TaxID=52904 RepID=A0A8D3AKP8_SCOMX
AHTRGTGAFFPPLLGLHPVFTSAFKSHDPAQSQSRTSGVDGTVNGRSGASPAENSAANSDSFPAKGNKEKTEASGCPKSGQDPGQLHQKTVQKTKEKVHVFIINSDAKSTSLICLILNSGSLSDSSSDDEESSSDADDMEEDEEDNDEDEDDQSNDSEDFDFETEGQVKRKVKVRVCVKVQLFVHFLSLPHSNDTNLFLNHRPNGAFHSEVQDAPLALITKPRSQSSTLNNKPLLAATSPSDPMPINLSTCSKEPSGRSLPKTLTSCAPVDLVRGSESDMHSSKDSDSDSLGDDFDEDDEDDIEDEDSGSRSGKRRRVTDERVLRLPLEFGWQRETRIRTVAGRLQGEVTYFAPCGKKLRQYPDVMKYLLRNGITEISRDNFSFSTKIKVGDFYEAREGPEGLQWVLLAEEEIAPSIIAMDGRRSRRLGSEHQPTGWKAHPLNVGENNFPDVNNAKLQRKLEAQEIARQAAQIKLMRKLEKQAMAQAAKEAKKQQAIMAAEERRKKREQMKIHKQQEKIKRIQQIRMEKELRAQQILEAKRKKKEEAANARILEAEKRNKASKRDLRERERRRQHMMLMKAVETRKKAEEKERLKKEKKDEKRLNKERKLELRRLELEKAKELKKPNEDLCLADHKRLPELSRIPGLVLPGSTFSDCLMVLQFLRSFGKVLGMNLNNLNLSDLQEGLLNIRDSMGKVQDLLVSMVSAAVRDPGLPAGHKSKTALGEHLTNVEINRDNVSEILQIYMEAHCEQTESAALALSLRTKAFQAHSPSQKASMLAFLVNELCCSKAVISEIDKNIDNMTNLRKDKWVVEGKLRKLKSIHTKRTGKRESSVGGEDSHTFVIPTARSKCKRKEGDSEEEEDEDDDSEDQVDDDEEEEEDSGGKKGKKAEICEEEVSNSRMPFTDASS